MRIFGTVKIPGFDADDYTTAVRKALQVQFRRAAGAFIRAAVPRIPVETGMARGAFLNIGLFLRLSLDPIIPTRFNQFYYAGRIRVPKTPESGAALTTQPQDIIKIKGDKISFELESRIFHLTLEDIIGVRSPTAPWGAFEAGRNAFIAEMRNLRTRLPKASSYITTTSVTFGNGVLTRSEPIRLRRQETVSG